VAELRPHIDEIRAMGVNLAVVGNGAPNFLRGFVEDLQIPPTLPVLTDEKRLTYRAAGWTRATPLSLMLKSFAKGVVASFKYRQKRVMGDVFQLGGVAVIKPDGSMPWHFGSTYAGDHPPLETVLAEVRKAAA
jgi:hypothetical protein